MAFLIFIAFPRLTNAQATYKIAPGKDVNIKVKGSSNVHDWNMVSPTMISTGDFKFDSNSKLNSLSAFSFSLETKSLKSQHGAMNTRTYKALKADKFPKIIYKLQSAVITRIQKNKYLVKSSGDLTIAGAKKNILMDVTVVVNPDNTITCSGSQKLKFTDYNMSPPSYMAGTMKVENDIAIQFNLTYKK